MRVWKYVLEGSDCTLLMPYGARILAVGMQNGDIVIWAETTGGSADTLRRFCAINTGGAVPVAAEYCGTIQSPSGIVWHIYEVPVDGR